MTHDLFSEKISAWLDSELSPTEVTELQAHLAQCPACRQTYQVMQQFDRLFSSAAELVVAPPPGFSQRVEARLAYARPVQRWRIWLGLGTLVLSTLFFAAIALTVAGVALVSTGSAVLDAGLFYRLLAGLHELLKATSGLVSLAELSLKACVMMMSQPLFWISALGTLVLGWLWLRVLKSIYQQATATVELLIF